MASDFPASLDAFPDPLVNSPLNSPSHAVLHQDVNDAVEKIEVKLGVGVSPASGASAGAVLMADGAGSTQWASITADEIDSTGVLAQRVLAADGAGGAAWVLNETGLVLVTSGTLSLTATDFVGCFTSTYDNYRVIIRNATLSAATDLCWTLLTGVTPITGNYFLAFRGITSTGSGFDQSSQAAAFGRTGGASNSAAGSRIQVSMDIVQPALVAPTMVTSNAYMLLAGTGEYATRVGGCAHDSATAHNGLRIQSAGGQTIGGQVEIYGYRK
jgi:hypothetical protein